MRGKAFVIALALSLTACAAHSEVKSDYDKDYDFARLKTFDFKHQARSVKDPLGSNDLWNRRIQNELQSEFAKSGYTQAGNKTPDFLVAYYMGTRQMEDVRFIGYGYPGVASWRRGGWLEPGRDCGESRTRVHVGHRRDPRRRELGGRGYDTEPSIRQGRRHSSRGDK